VLDVLRANAPAEVESPDETNAVLRWLRTRLTRHSSVIPFRPEEFIGERGTRGTPAVEAALQQAAQLAGPLPVGSHHLLLAALNDTDSAASSALSSLGVDLDELRDRLRSANLTGTSDELPQEAGRRQMAIEVSGEILTIVLTDPVIVAAGREALRVVNAGQAAAGEAGDGDPAGGTEPQGTEPQATEPQATDPQGTEPQATDSGSASATSRVIRGDHPGAAGLADVWLELRDTLATLAGATPPPSRARRTRVVRHVRASKLLAEPAADDPGADDPGEAAAP
jgi:hypothetical protein